MAVMSRTAVVLTREAVDRTGAWFSTPQEEQAHDTILCCMQLGDYEDLGQPDTVTVTIEPGDRLND